MRFNANPDQKNYLNKEYQGSGLYGNFIIDKNINRNKYYPSSLLLPESSSFHFTNQELKKELIYGPRFKERNSPYNPFKNKNSLIDQVSPDFLS